MMETINQLNFKKAIEVACKADYEELELKTNSSTYTFSQEFERDMNELIIQGNVHCHHNKKKKWKIALFVAVLIGLAASVVTANEEIRTKIGNLLVNFYDQCIEIIGMENGKSSGELFEKHTLSSIPDGYILIKEEDNIPAWYIEKYENEKDEILIYSQYDSQSTDIFVTYNTYGIKEEISVCDSEAFIVSDGDITSICFEKDGYTYVISATGNVDLGSLAESIAFQ